MTRPHHRPVFMAAANLTAAAFRARAHGMTGPEARHLAEAESARLPEDHPLAQAAAAYAREVGFAHGNLPRIRAAADRLHRTATLAMLPEQPHRADIHG